MKLFSKPVIILGHGCRSAGADPARLLELGVPVLTSWQGMDLVDNWHPAYFGRPGIYGQRTANRILYEADQIISIGARMCPWMIGHAGLRPEQKLTMVDIDRAEATKYQNMEWIQQDAKDFIESWNPDVSCYLWLKQCERWRTDWVEYPLHDDTNGFINSYQFIRRLESFLPADAHITVDNGSVMCPVFQSLRVKPPQRVMTAGALGEMGCGIPGAIGTSFARGKGEVFSFIGDGGMMMNLQDLATIAHHKLPVKIMVFANDGYSMIKGTYDNVKKARVGVSSDTGLSFPNFVHVAAAFGIQPAEIRTWQDFDAIVPKMVETAGPMLTVVHIDPEQAFMPRLKPIIEDGKITPARFDQLSPIL